VTRIRLHGGVTAIGKGEVSKRLRADVALHTGHSCLLCEWLFRGSGCQWHWIKIRFVDQPVGLVHDIALCINLGLVRYPSVAIKSSFGAHGHRLVEDERGGLWNSIEESLEPICILQATIAPELVVL
jgi:hypothetical protein